MINKKINFIYICGVMGVAFSSGAYAAEGDLLTPYVFYAVQYDDNIFRLSGDAEAQALLGTTDTSDTIQQIGAGLDVKIPVSRQVYSIHLDAARNLYNDFDFLDYTSAHANLLWDWRYGDAWKGKAGYDFTQDISTFDELDSVQKDERHINKIYFSANHALSPRWAMEMGLNYRDTDHDLLTQKKLDRELTTASAELRYSTRRYSYVGIRATVQDAEFPNRELVLTNLVDNSYQENEFSVTVNWVTVGTSKLKGRVGYTSRDHDEFSQRDFSGATGKLQYIWVPRGKLKIDFSIWNDLNAYTDSTASYVEESGFSIKPTWTPSPKLELSAEYSQKDRDYDGDPRLIVTALPTREDEVKTTDIAITYYPWRNVTSALTYRKEDRESNILLDEYDYYSVTASVEVRF